MDNTTFIHGLRWLAVLPAAGAASFALGWINLVLTRLYTGIMPDTAGGVLLSLALYGLMGAAFVAAGVVIAPSHHATTAIVLAAVALLFGVHVVRTGWLLGDWGEIATGVALAAGGAYAAWTALNLPAESSGHPSRRAGPR